MQMESAECPGVCSTHPMVSPIGKSSEGRSRRPMPGLGEKAHTWGAHRRSNSSSAPR